MRAVMAVEMGHGAVPADVCAEMVRQHRQVGAHGSHERWITVMTEELGEIARAYLHEDVEDRPVEMTSRQELLQLTAICLRALDDCGMCDDAPRSCTPPRGSGEHDRQSGRVDP